MRTTIDLPDSLLQELRTRAAQNGQTLNFLLNELILRAMRTPAMPELAQAASALPVLKRLQTPQGEAVKSALPKRNKQLEDLGLLENTEKQRSIGFIR